MPELIRNHCGLAADSCTLPFCRPRVRSRWKPEAACGLRHVDPVVVAVALAVALDVCGTPMQALGHSSSLGKASVVSIDREGFLQGCRNPVDLAECRLAVRVDTRIREAKPPRVPGTHLNPGPDVPYEVGPYLKPAPPKHASVPSTGTALSDTRRRFHP